MIPPKSDREVLLQWLATAAARLRWSRVARELGWLAAALVALYLLAKLPPALPPVRSALAPLFAAAALALIAVFLWRLTRPTTLAQAAGAADTRAGLKDQFKSAQWFAQGATRSALVELLIARAARTTRSLDARSLFPLGVPRGALTALGLAVLSVVWFSPGTVLPVPREQAAAATPLAPGEKDLKNPGVAPPPNAVMNDRQSAGAPQTEVLALPSMAKADSITPVASARGEGVAAPRRSQRDQATPRDPSAQRELKAANSTQQPGESPQGASGRGNKVPVEPPVKAEIEPTTRVAARLREQARLEQRKITGQPTQGEVTLNSRLRAVSRSGASMREVAYGEGEAAEAGAQTSVSGAASGDRTGRSQAGGSEGEHPNSSPTGDGDDQPVLGERTERLQALVEKMGFGPAPESQGRETEEKFYAATQRRAAQAVSETVASRWRLQQEKSLPPGETPLSYREAVKQYFLSQHAKER